MKTNAVVQTPPPTPPLSTIFGNLDVKPNSSNSILPKKIELFNRDSTFPDISGPNYHSAPASYNNHNHTPQAIPLNDFLLTYEKPARGPDIHNHELLDGLDEEVQDLINGVDNFMVDFINTTCEFVASIRCC